MKTATGLPPNIEDIKKVLTPSHRTVFTYGDTVYLQDNQATPDLLAHEEVHVGQQGSDPKAWWDNYLKDPAFRLEQEVEAYRTQYQYVKEHFPTKAHKNVLFQLADSLCGETYGSVLTFQEAENKIRKCVNNT